MLSTEFEVLTPLSKIHRISRQIADREEFAIEPGMWVKLNAQGQVVNYVLDDGSTPGTPHPVEPEEGDVVELCINSAVNGALSAYEGNDTKVGRITTIMEPGVRLWVGTGLIDGITGASDIGKKVFINGAVDGDITGTPNVVGGWKMGAAGMAVGIITNATGDGKVEIRLIEPTWV